MILNVLQDWANESNMWLLWTRVLTREEGKSHGIGEGKRNPAGIVWNQSYQCVPYFENIFMCLFMQDMNVCMYKCIYMHLLPSFVCWKGQEAITPQWVCPGTLSTPSTHILVSNTIPHWKEPGFLGETVYSRAEAGYIKDDPGKFYYAIN